MRDKKSYLFILLALCMSYFATLPAADLPANYPNFIDNPYLDDNKRQMMAPYLLPLDHPLKPTLDSIFSKTRVTQDMQSLLDAGFTIIAGPMRFSFVIVARHPLVPGYVFKLYLDSDGRSRRGIPHWLSFVRRCNGAEGIRKVIRCKNIQNFAVPDKWIYVLPVQPFSNVPNQEPVILMETDMQPENEAVSRQKWRTEVTRKHLDELYAILKFGYGGQGVLSLSINVPYSKTGKFVFTDTESPKRHLNLKSVKKYFSKDMRRYWDSLVD